MARDLILILLPGEPPSALIDRLKKNHPSYDVTFCKIPGYASAGALNDAIDLPSGMLNSYKTWLIQETFANATVLVTLRALPKPGQCPKLKFIHFLSAGVNHILEDPIYKETVIPLTTSSGIHGPQISEWVILTALAHAHKFPLMLDWQRERKWGGFPDMSVIDDYASQKLGVLGYGSIGRQVARVGKAMGMDVIAYTAGPRTTPESKRDTGYIVPGTGDADGSIPSEWFSGTSKEELHHFLAQDIDVLVISVPLTPATRHLLGRDEFEILGKKKHALISNISRGGIIDQEALIEYCRKPLEEGGLRGAALDVTEPEPLPSDSELWNIPNIFISPHISGTTKSYTDRSFQVLELNLTHLEQGKPLVNQVDRKRGY